MCESAAVLDMAAEEVHTLDAIVLPLKEDQTVEMAVEVVMLS